MGSVASLVATQSIRTAKTRRSGRKAIAKHNSTAHVDALNSIEQLNAASREKIIRFIESGEFSQFGLQVTVAVAAKNDRLQATLRDSMKESLRLYKAVPQEDVELVAEALFEDLLSAITLELSRLGSTGFSDMSAKVVSAQASAALRNYEIIERIEDLSKFDEFCKDFSRQVSLLDSKVRPPQIDAGRRVPIDRIYVESALSNSDAKEFSFDDDEISPKYIFETHSRIVILGDPGGGKSTLAAKLCVDLARGRRRGSTPARVPFKIVMRDYGVHFQRTKTSITEYIERVCTATYSTPPPNGCVEYLLLNGRTAVVFDGLDELTDAALRQDMVQAVEAFCMAYPSVPVMVTSRKVGYDLAPLDTQIFQTLFLTQFSPLQRASYVTKWFTSMRSGSQVEKHKLAQEFLAEMPHAEDLSTNPLMLGLMCAMYRGAGFIPRNRPELYRRCSEFLFERWDSSRGISVEKPFERGIQNAMFSLALSMLKSPENAAGLTERRLVQFTTQHLYGRHYEDFDAAQEAAREFVRYCRGRAWVLTDVGTDASGNDLYSFTHRTFLEYFAGRQLIRECPDVPTLVSTLYPKLKEQEWDVVSQLAVQGLDERLLDGSNEAIIALIESARNEDESDPKEAIASFCCRAVEFMDLRPATLRAITSFYGECFVAVNAEKRSVGFGFRAAAEGLVKSPRDLRAVIVDQARQVAAKASDSDAALAFAATLGVFSRESAYWREQSRETIEIFADRFYDASRRNPWFATLLHKQGKLSVREGLQNHGVKFLLDTPDCPKGLPGGHNHLSSLVYGEQFDMPGEWHSAEATPEEADEIVRFVINEPRPWRTSIGSHAWVHDESEAIPPCASTFFLHIVNILLAEDFMAREVVNKRFAAGTRGAVYRSLFRARAGKIPRSRLAEHLTMFTETQQKFLEGWVMREFELLAGLKSGDSVTVSDNAGG
ncbi:NACHT domain-containing protein [Streptomyces fungicidicus]|uniref:NACHT domain-containing protein n=1 Tax=Streptomyces fungicidicus TaxID=68203 RepID=UPI0038109AC7